MNTQSQNIAILGAGIMGLSAAYALLKDGHKITIYDPKGFPAENASPNASRVAGGMLAPYSEIEHMPMEWVQAGFTGIEFWQKHFPDQVQKNGSLLIAHKEDQYILERFRSHLPAEKQPFRATEPLEPALKDRFPQGLYLEEEAHLTPGPMLTALCKAIKELDGTFLAENAESTRLGTEYDHIIDCRGMSTNDPNLRGVKGEIVIVRNEEFTLSRPVRLMHPRYPLYIVPRDDHIFMIGATVIESADERVSLRSGLELLSALYSLSPSFGEAHILSIQAGIRPSYPDNLPRIKLNGNIISCNGLFRHGYLLAPVMAESVKEHITGNTHEFWTLLTTGATHDHHDQRTEENIRSAA